MMRITFACLLFFACAAFQCSGQHWRVELSGGIVTPADLKPDKKIIRPPSLFQTYSPMSIESSAGAVTGLGGLKIMHTDSAYEWGIGADVFAIRFPGGQRSFDTTTGSGPKPGVHQDAYLARPAIPLRGFINYCHHRSRTYAFIGVSAGAVFARGRDMEDAYKLSAGADWSIYFHDAVGYMLGTQLGLRHSLGRRLDIGGELAANFMHLPLAQGTSHAAYTYNLFYFPIAIFAGYSF